MLSVAKEKGQAFLGMLKLLDFVKIESKEELLRRFIQNVPLTEADVVNEVMEHRYGKKQRPMQNFSGCSFYTSRRQILGIAKSAIRKKKQGERAW